MNSMALITKVAGKSNHKQHRHSSFVISGGAIQAMACNFNVHHAEVNALKQLWPSKRVGVKVYSFRWRKDGTLGMAKPCAACEQYMRDNGVKMVYYSDATGQIQRMKL